MSEDVRRQGQVHPILRPEVQIEIQRWTDKLLSETGSATVEITIEFDVRDGRFRSYRLGGAASRRPLTGPEESVRSY